MQKKGKKAQWQNKHKQRTYCASAQRKLYGVQVWDRTPDFSDQTLLGHINVAQVECVVDCLHLPHFDEPNPHCLRGGLQHPLTMILCLVQHLEWHIILQQHVCLLLNSVIHNLAIYWQYVLSVSLSMQTWVKGSVGVQLCIVQSWQSHTRTKCSGRFFFSRPNKDKPWGNHNTKSWRKGHSEQNDKAQEHTHLHYVSFWISEQNTFYKGKLDRTMGTLINFLFRRQQVTKSTKNDWSK